MERCVCYQNACSFIIIICIISIINIINEKALIVQIIQFLLIMRGSSCMRPSFTKCTIMYCKQIAGPKRAKWRHICIFTRTVHQPDFIQIANVLDLQFQGQRLELNILENTCEKHGVFICTAKAKWTNYANHHDVKGWQELRHTIILAKICQWVC